MLPDDGGAREKGGWRGIRAAENNHRRLRQRAGPASALEKSGDRMPVPQGLADKSSAGVGSWRWPVLDRSLAIGTGSPAPPQSNRVQRLKKRQIRVVAPTRNKVSEPPVTRCLRLAMPASPQVVCTGGSTISTAAQGDRRRAAGRRCSFGCPWSREPGHAPGLLELCIGIL